MMDGEASRRSSGRVYAPRDGGGNASDVDGERPRAIAAGEVCARAARSRREITADAHDLDRIRTGRCPRNGLPVRRASARYRSTHGVVDARRPAGEWQEWPNEAGARG